MVLLISAEIWEVVDPFTTSQIQLDVFIQKEVKALGKGKAAEYSVVMFPVELVMFQPKVHYPTRTILQNDKLSFGLVRTGWNVDVHVKLFYLLICLVPLILSIIQPFKIMLGLSMTLQADRLPLLCLLSPGAELVDMVSGSHNKHFSK